MDWSGRLPLVLYMLFLMCGCGDTHCLDLVVTNHGHKPAVGGNSPRKLTFDVQRKNSSDCDSDEDPNQTPAVVLFYYLSSPRNLFCRIRLDASGGCVTSRTGAVVDENCLCHDQDHTFSVTNDLGRGWDATLMLKNGQSLGFTFTEEKLDASTVSPGDGLTTATTPTGQSRVREGDPLVDEADDRRETGSAASGTVDDLPTTTTSTSIIVIVIVVVAVIVVVFVVVVLAVVVVVVVKRRRGTPPNMDRGAQPSLPSAAQLEPQPRSEESAVSIRIVYKRGDSTPRIQTSAAQSTSTSSDGYLEPRKTLPEFVGSAVYTLPDAISVFTTDSDESVDSISTPKGTVDAAGYIRFNTKPTLPSAGPSKSSTRRKNFSDHYDIPEIDKVGVRPSCPGGNSRVSRESDSPFR